ncbi:MAG: hypothetical protein AAGA47_07305 [Pseudomonadota bacterium]
MVDGVSVTGFPEPVDRGVVPEFGPIAATLGQLDTAEMRRTGFLEHAYGLILGTIKTAHDAMDLVQDAEVEKAKALRLSGGINSSIWHQSM